MWEPVAAGDTINITKKKKNYCYMLKREEIFWFYSTAVLVQGVEKNLPFKYYYKEKTIKYTPPMVQIFGFYLRKPPLQTSISIEKMYSKA